MHNLQRGFVHKQVYNRHHAHKFMNIIINTHNDAYTKYRLSIHKAGKTCALIGILCQIVCVCVSVRAHACLYTCVCVCVCDMNVKTGKYLRYTLT